MKVFFSKGRELISFRVILSGVLNAYIMTLLLFCILALLLYFTSLSETLIPMATMAISVTSILFCGIKATRNVEKFGWLHGSFIGISYILFLLLIGFFSNKTPPSAWGAITDIVIGFITGTLSGVLGVNL